MTTLPDLTKPAIAVHPWNGITYVAGYDGSNWVCYKRLTDADSFVLAGTIIDASGDTYAGLEVAADPSGRLVFIVQKGSDLRVFESFDCGESWVAA